MPRSTALFLQDIIDAAEAVARYTRDGENSFARDPMVQDAVLFRLIVIGEAVKNLAAKGLDVTTLEPQMAWRNAPRTRDVLAHNYWAIEPDRLWVAVQQLPQLAAEAQALIDRGPFPRPPAKRRGKRAS